MTELLWVYLIFIVIGLVLAVLWLIMPFIIMQMQRDVGRMLFEQQRTNHLLDERLPALRAQPRRE